MGFLYFLPAGTYSLLLVVALWLAFMAGIIRWVGRERFLQFFLLCLFFFPKKTVAADWWGGLLAGYFGPSSPVVLSFFDTVLMPTLVLTGLIAYRGTTAASPDRRYLLATGAYAVFACGGAVRYLLAGNDLPSAYGAVVVGCSIAAAAPYLLVKILAERQATVEDLFVRYAKWLVLLLFVEYMAASSGVLPASLSRFSIDYRGGFRSAVLGYSVFVSLFGMIGFIFAVRDYLAGRRQFDLLTVFMALVLVLATFERAALFASGIFVLLLVFSVARHRLYGLFAVACVMALASVEFSNSWNHRAEASSAESTSSSLSIVRAKGGSLLHTSSLSERFALQLRAVDVFLDAPLTGYGVNSYFVTSVSAVAPVMRSIAEGRVRELYENVVSGRKQSNPHNVFVQTMAETGLGVLAFISFALILPLAAALRARSGGAKERESLAAAVAVLMTLHAYFTFQSAPPYYFLFVIAVAAVAGMQREPGATQASDRNGSSQG